MNHFELIIFDCDGVLVDSERLANETFARILHEEFCLTLSLEEMFQTFVGRSAKQCMTIVETLTGNKAPTHLLQRYQDDINHALSTSVAAVSGIEQAITNITIPFCVASSGSYEKMHITLGKTNLLRHFEGKLHSTADVANSKPAPDIYLHAANKMGGFDPAKCLVIEDSPLGVAGGVNAGMTVFGYAELMDENKLLAAGAHHIFKNMRDLVKEIERFVPNSSS